MYVIEKVSNPNSRPQILLRERKRVRKRVVNKTLLNLTDWPSNVVDGLRRTLNGETLVSVEDVFSVVDSRPHGHVEAVLGTAIKLGLDRLISPERSRHRDLVMAMIVEQIIKPDSKLSARLNWHTTTLAEEIGLKDIMESEIHKALDWLLERKERIEQNLFRRYLTDEGEAICNITSIDHEDLVRSMSLNGQNRSEMELKPNRICLSITDVQGRPIAVDVIPTKSREFVECLARVKNLKKSFGLKHIILVRDRDTQNGAWIQKLKKKSKHGWISVRREEFIHRLVKSGDLNLSQINKNIPTEIDSSQFPGERLIAYLDSILATERRFRRNERLKRADKKLACFASKVENSEKDTFVKEAISKKANSIIKQCKAEKYYNLLTEDGRFEFSRKSEVIKRDRAIDGIYIIHTSETKERLSATEILRLYRNYTYIEQTFRVLNDPNPFLRNSDIERTKTVEQVCTLLNMLAYYVERQMRVALAPLLMNNERLDDSSMIRDSEKSETSKPPSICNNKSSHVGDGPPRYRYNSVLEKLGQRCRIRCKAKKGEKEYLFFQHSALLPLQKSAFELLDLEIKR